MNARQSYLQSLLPKPSPVSNPSLLTLATAAIPIVDVPNTSDPKPKPKPWNPSQFELWVEDGVVWDLKTLTVMGFIDYSSIAPYFAPTPFKANKTMFGGSPFSLTDFPTYGLWDDDPAMGWIFSALNMLSFLPTAWYLFRGQGLTNGKTSPPGGAGPAASAKDMGLFLAQSPSGTQTFSAKYVGYMWQVKPTLQPWWPPA